ncbi:DUF748 domain-containing protein [Candidatus Nitronereus thalassa]|uniref:DUF748 domain-containing protein n=1 Tax=Candidatus Nitronereus thalassa TaxID=3020898 RepID=A0ABU3K751_9BACT|nr:DUF748 domain-containing protein [Candidatus Nitronereus thalassa]MDT7042197.1 DUF748 domain-containing protein [Candidatus Nitronereus thalassa]
MRIFKILRILVLIALGLVGLYAAIGFLGVPWAVKKYGVPEVSKILERPVMLRDMSFDPFAFNLKLEGFEIRDTDGSPLVGFEQLFVNFEATSLLSDAYRFDIIRLSLPFGLVKILKDGRLNLAEVGGISGEPSAPEQESSTSLSADEKPFLVDIGLLSIEQGALEFRDESKSPTFIADIVPLQVTLRNFSTRPGNQNSYFLAAELSEGERVQWQGNVSMDPLRSQGQVEISSLRAGSLWEYVEDQFRFEISQGLLDLQVIYDVDMAQDPVGVVLNKGTMTLRNFALRQKGHTDELIVVPSFSIRGIEADVGARQVFIDSIQSRGADVQGWINPDGTVNFQNLFASQENSEVPEEVETSSPQNVDSEGPPWSATIKTISLEEYAVRFEDRQPSKRVPLNIKGLSLQAQNVTTDLQKPIALELGLTFNQSGKLSVSGQVTPDPPRGDLTLALSGVSFAPFQPYLEPYGQFQLVRGSLGLKGRTTFTSQSGQDANVSFSGDITIGDVALVDPVASEEFLKWEQLAFQGMAVESQPPRVSLEEVMVTLPYAKVVKNSEGTLNVERLFSPVEPAAGSSKEEGKTMDGKSLTSENKAATPSPLITINTVRIQNAGVDFMDQAIDPQVVTGIQSLTGTIQGLSSQELSKANVSLEGRVDDVASLKIQGQVNPLQEDLYTDVKVLFQNLDLTTVSPYAGKYIGYPIDKGKLSLDLDYSLSENVLIGENKVQVEQLALGEATGSPDAPSLPVPLAVALLKDRDGRIDIDLPVRGDLNDPEFSYGQLVLQTLVNLITKAATSPFSLVGGLLGGSGEDLSFVQFSPGQAILTERENEKLSTLAMALSERPGLRLEITSSVEPTLDGPALSAAKLEDQIIQLRQQELATSAKGELPSATEVALSSLDQERLLKKLYMEKFGEELGKESVTDNASTKNAPGVSEESLKGSGPGTTPKPGFNENMPTTEKMRLRLLKTIQVSDDELRLLGQDRAKSIRDHLVEQENIPEERIFLVEPNLTSEAEGQSIRTNLTLTAQ